MQSQSQSQRVFPSSTRESDIDDYIGMESCVDMKENQTAADTMPPSPPMKFSDKRENKMWGGTGRKEREYPPPIPLLVRTENLASHMPWVLKRHYTGDGRLILTEEKVRHHEYFRAHRSDGRLMLQLVALDDGDGESGQDQEDEDEDFEKGGKMKCLKNGIVRRRRDPALMFGVAVPALSGGTLRTVRS